MRRIALLCGSLGGLLVLAACNGGTQYGSPTVRTTVNTVPDSAIVYAIPQHVWSSRGGEAMLEDGALLAKFRVGRSPVEEDFKRDRRYVVVAEHEGRFEWVERTITSEDTSLSLRVPD